mmetsp:Transcript_106801/g.298972  ORF Transcript_106801/g.298972 Transcript_106801/m.298972 type:complete len:217 (-) Transcript_106801:403-1053(-)
MSSPSSCFNSCCPSLNTVGVRPSMPVNGSTGSILASKSKIARNSTSCKYRANAKRRRWPFKRRVPASLMFLPCSSRSAIWRFLASFASSPGGSSSAPSGPSMARSAIVAGPASKDSISTSSSTSTESPSFMNASAEPAGDGGAAMTNDHGAVSRARSPGRMRCRPNSTASHATPSPIVMRDVSPTTPGTSRPPTTTRAMRYSTMSPQRGPSSPGWP